MVKKKKIYSSDTGNKWHSKAKESTRRKHNTTTKKRK